MTTAPASVLGSSGRAAADPSGVDAARSSFALPKDKAGPASWMAVIFVLSLIVPINIFVGPILLMPHRVVLLLFFFPVLWMLVSGKAGRILLADWLIGLATFWSILSLMVVHGISERIEAIGIHVVEFYGAYLLARATIRTAADFRRVVLTIFGMMLFMLPFAAAEAFLFRNFLLENIPGSIRIVNAGVRWGMRRAHVLFTHPIHFGVFSSLGMGLFWYMLRPTLRPIVTPIVGASTVFALSTGGLICLVIQCGFIGWEIVMKSMRRRWLLLASLAAGAYIFLSFASNSGPFDILIRYASFNTGSAYNRILIWQFGTQNVAANPIFGIGFNPWVRPEYMSSSADNYWLVLTMMFGLPMIALYAGGLLTLWWAIIRTKLTDGYDWRCRAAYLTAVGGIIIGGGTVHFWTAMMAYVMFVFGSAGWIAGGGAKEAEEGEGPAPEPEPERRGMTYTRFPAQQRSETGPVFARSHPRALPKPGSR